MDKTERICWIGIIISLLFLGWLCNRPIKQQTKETTKEIIDYNIFYNEIDAMYQSRQLSLYDSIETLNKRLKYTKTIFITKYRQILKDSLITDSNCLLTLYYANETINQQDSIINLQSRSLDACGSQIINLRNQVEWNEKQNEVLTKNVYKLSTENEKSERKVKRNRLFAGIVSAILVSFVLIK